MSVICCGGICIPWVSVYAFLAFLAKLAYDFYQRMTGEAQTLEAKKAGATLRSQQPAEAKTKALRGKRTRVSDGDAAAATAPDAGVPRTPRVETVETEEDWEVLLGDAAQGKAAVVQFTAGWCKPCKAMRPFFDELSALYPEITFGVVDVDNEDLLDVVQNQGLGTLPYFGAYRGGASMDYYSGSDKEKLERLLAVFESSSACSAGCCE